MTTYYGVDKNIEIRSTLISVYPQNGSRYGYEEISIKPDRIVSVRTEGNKLRIYYPHPIKIMGTMMVQIEYESRYKAEDVCREIQQVVSCAKKQTVQEKRYTSKQPKPEAAPQPSVQASSAGPKKHHPALVVFFLFFVVGMIGNGFNNNAKKQAPPIPAVSDSATEIGTPSMIVLEILRQHESSFGLFVSVMDK